MSNNFSGIHHGMAKSVYKKGRHSGESRNPGRNLSSKEANVLDPVFRRDDDNKKPFYTCFKR